MVKINSGRKTMKNICWSKYLDPKLTMGLKVLVILKVLPLQYLLESANSLCFWRNSELVTALSHFLTFIIFFTIETCLQRLQVCTVKI